MHSKNMPPWLGQPKFAKNDSKIREISGIYSGANVYTLVLRGIISMAAPKEAQPREKTKTSSKEVSDHGKVGTLATHQ